MNLERIETDAPVERCFGDLIDWRARQPMWLDPTTGREHRAVSAVEHYAAVQRRVRYWLKRIARSERHHAKVAREVEAVLAEHVEVAALVLRRRRLAFVYDFGSVLGVCAVAVALILDERYGLASRVLFCAAPGCGRLHLQLNPKGRPRRFCNDKHKAAADRLTGAERVHRHRKLLNSQWS